MEVVQGTEHHGASRAGLRGWAARCQRFLFRCLSYDWFIGLILLGIFFLTNGYTYGWDDQHLEIPHLKSLINPALYPGDYYIEALRGKFLSLMYPLLARMITIDQIPAVYFTLFVLSRYFLFLFMFKLWRQISGHRATAFGCILMMMVLGRVDEFLYRTFSHQELALAFVAAGFLYFFRRRFVLASVIFGLGTNIHAVYCLFPMAYLGWHVLVYEREARWKKLASACGAYLLCALPLLIWMVKNYLATSGGPKPDLEEWRPLYYLFCPQNFLFYDRSLQDLTASWATFFKYTLDYWFLAILFALNWFFNPMLRQDRRVHSIFQAAILLLGLSFVFTYLVPSRFFLNLNLVRNVQYMHFFLVGYTAILWRDQCGGDKGALIAGITTVVIFLIRFGQPTASLAFGALIFVLFASEHRNRADEGARLQRWVPVGVGIVGAFICVAFVIKSFEWGGYSIFTKWSLLAILGMVMTVIGSFCVVRAPFDRRWFLRALIPGTFLIAIIASTGYHVKWLRVARFGGGFWELQRDWIDMQHYVREHVPPDALLLVPNDTEMGGFRIHSERSILVCYRDCGVAGFDFEAGREWQTRLNDIKNYKVFIQDPIGEDLMTAVTKYGADYVVAMSYARLDTVPVLEPMYKNTVFQLFRIKR